MKKKITTSRNRPAKRSRTMAEHYRYTVGWSEDDEAYVARIVEFPSLGAHGASQEAALHSLQRIVRAVLKELALSTEPIPQPIGKRSISSRLNFGLGRV
jgi:predicted RNase H-like HicB family nuclease